MEKKREREKWREREIERDGRRDIKTGRRGEPVRRRDGGTDGHREADGQT